MNLFIERKFVESSIAERIPGSGIDYKKFSPIILKENDSNSFIFLFIGRLIKDKGIFEYINAARIIKKKYPNAIFNVMGPFWTPEFKKEYHNTHSITKLD